MQWNISAYKLREQTVRTCLFLLCAFLVAGCANFQMASSGEQTAPPSPAGHEDMTPALAADEVEMRIDLAQMPDQTSIQKTSTQSMKVGERKTVASGGDILRVLRYNEEVVVLPKMSASSDFTVALTNSVVTTAQDPETLMGYSNVTYEVFSSPSVGEVLLLGKVFAVPGANGRLEQDVFMPSGKPGVFRRLTAEVKPSTVTFKKITRNKVISSSETHYVIRFVKKDGMAVLFEVRTLRGGSRPRVISRQPVSVPLGTPIITIKGHKFKVHTITPDFIDIERLS